VRRSSLVTNDRVSGALALVLLIAFGQVRPGYLAHLCIAFRLPSASLRGVRSCIADCHPARRENGGLSAVTWLPCRAFPPVVFFATHTAMECGSDRFAADALADRTHPLVCSHLVPGSGPYAGPCDGF